VLILLLGNLVPSHAQERPAQESTFSLQPGDVIRVVIWREADLSGDFLIDENGDIVFPLLGQRHVAGVPIGQLRDSLFEAYRAELRNPSIIITPLRRVYVLGEVNAPGLYTVDPTISVAGAVAMAGGANGQGDLRKIRVVRRGGEVGEGISVDSPLAHSNILSGDQIFVGRRSWFDRNSTFVVSALLSVTSIVISLAR
jgi:polysaccharide export outer membrane protein